MKVLWITNLPSPYRVYFFNELGKRCDLYVIAERSSSSDRDKSWSNIDVSNFHLRILPGINTGPSTAFCPEIVRYLNKDYDHVVVTNISSPTGILALRWLKLRKIPFFIETDGGIPKTGRGVKEYIKKINIRGAQLYFSTAEIHDEYYITYGVSPERIVRYPFTSIKQDDIIENPISTSEKLRIREKLGMKEQTIVLAVGQFIRRKGFDVLIDACKNLDNSFGIYIIGGKAPDEYTHIVNELQLRNVYFIDFKIREELDQYYCAADMFVHPTREDIWGLVINEAMAKGLPVITTDRCIAGIELIRNGYNGYIVPVEDSAMLADKIKLTAPQAEALGKNSLDIIRSYTIEKMAEKHISVFSGMG